MSCKWHITSNFAKFLVQKLYFDEFWSSKSVKSTKNSILANFEKVKIAILTNFEKQNGENIIICQIKKVFKIALKKGLSKFEAL